MMASVPQVKRTKSGIDGEAYPGFCLTQSGPLLLAATLAEKIACIVKMNASTPQLPKYRVNVEAVAIAAALFLIVPAIVSYYFYPEYFVRIVGIWFGYFIVGRILLTPMEMMISVYNETVWTRRSVDDATFDYLLWPVVSVFCFIYVPLILIIRAFFRNPPPAN
jgi:hypothetical protein